MTFLTCSVIVVLGCAFSQNVEAQVVNPSAALNMFPYFSPMGYPRPSYLSATTDEQLLALANQHCINPSYMYQMYEILNSYTSLTIEQDINILRRVGALMERRRTRYGLPSRGCNNGYYLPNAPSLNMMARREPGVISGLMSDIRTNFNGAMENISDTLWNYLPGLMTGLDEEMDDIMGTEIPEAIADDVSDLSSRMMRTVSNMMSDLW